MQSPQPTKSTRRTSLTRLVSKPLSITQVRHLEEKFEESSAKKNKHWNSNGDDPYVSNVIDAKSLLKIRPIYSRKQREKQSTILDDRIILNVGGDRYETHRTTLELYPDSLLGHSKRRQHYYNKKHQEYFFDRHRSCFGAILYYYQSHGCLRRPDYVPLDVFVEEVTFFQLGKEALDQLRKDENIKEVTKVCLPKNPLRRYLWATMEYPDYSFMAKIINVLSLLLVLISTISLAIESLPQYVNIEDFHCQKLQNTTTNQSELNNATSSSSSQDIYVCQWYFTSPFFIIQVICVAFFTIELLVRILSTPSLFHFIKNLMNWIDLLAVIPFYITLGIRLSGRENQINTDTYVGLRLLRILRLARVFKFCRVFKSVKSFRVLASTIHQSLADFLIMIVTLTLLGFLFGAAVYYAENDSNSTGFDSVLKATYWGIVTITAVGYGDITPVTATGRVICCLCASVGAVAIGVLVSILVDRYQRVYVRKLYYHDETIDFSDYSDDDDDDTELKDLSNSSEHRPTPNIDEPDARTKKMTLNETNSSDLPQTLDSSLVEEASSVEQDINRIHFIIGFVVDGKHKPSQHLIEKINSFVTDKQAAGDNISISFICNDTTKQSYPLEVYFELKSSDDEDDDLREITDGGDTRSNALETVDQSALQKDKQLNTLEKNVQNSVK